MRHAPRVRLRATRADDLPFVVDAEAHPENRRFIVRWSVGRHRVALSDPDVGHRIVEIPAERGHPGRRIPVGFLILRGLRSDRGGAGEVELLRLVITEKGRGYGRAALRAALGAAFRDHDAERVWLDVRRGNERARALYESEGLRRLEPAPTDGTSDLVIYAVDRPSKGTKKAARRLPARSVSSAN